MALGEFLGGAAGALGSLTKMFGGGGVGSAKDAYKIVAKVQDPEFRWEDITAPEIQLLAKYAPALYEAKIPSEVREFVESRAMREPQLQALLQMQGIAQEGLPEVDRLAAMDASRAVSDAARRGQLSAIRGLEERGRLGGGTELQARLLGNQQSSELARGLGSDITRDAMLRRLQAIGATGSMASGIRGQDLSAAEMINRFNFERAAMVNEANRWNAAQAQRVGEQNAMLPYENAWRNKESYNDLQRQLAMFQLNKAGVASGALKNLSDVQAAEKAGKINALMGIGKGVGALGDLGLGLGMAGAGGNYAKMAPFVL